MNVCCFTLFVWLPGPYFVITVYKIVDCECRDFSAAPVVVKR